jgi:predicted cobalt transporter CbtA
MDMTLPSFDFLLSYNYQYNAQAFKLDSSYRIYAAIMTGAYLVFPPNPDNITIPIDLIVNFRVVSALSVGIFWGLLGAILGILWDKRKPHETSRITSPSV